MSELRIVKGMHTIVPTVAEDLGERIAEFAAKVQPVYEFLGWGWGVQDDLDDRCDLVGLVERLSRKMENGTFETEVPTVEQIEENLRSLVRRSNDNGGNWSTSGGLKVETKEGHVVLSLVIEDCFFEEK